MHKINAEVSHNNVVSSSVFVCMYVCMCVYVCEDVDWSMNIHVRGVFAPALKSSAHAQLDARHL